MIKDEIKTILSMFPNTVVTPKQVYTMLEIDSGSRNLKYVRSVLKKMAEDRYLKCHQLHVHGNRVAYSIRLE